MLHFDTSGDDIPFRCVLVFKCKQVVAYFSRKLKITWQFLRKIIVLTGRFEKKNLAATLLSIIPIKC